MSRTPIAFAPGDGIGPEIATAVRRILVEAGAEIDFQDIEVGEKVYLAGHSSGITPDTWDVLRSTKVLLKGPITTPQGGGYKSLNVTMRKALGLYANVRPVVAFHPFIRTKHPKLDVVIVRENEEDLYAGIEHRQTDQVYQALKLVTRPGCEKIVRYGFEYAVRHNRKKVAVFVKDNIMKLTDGLFHQVFKDIGAEYQDLIKESWIIDIGAARLADTPEIFDVIVTLNLYGDIISDIAAQIGGSVGLGGSANIGDQCAMFEAIHGSAPPIAGLDIANPSGLLFGAIQMLVHIGQPAVATRIHNAWLRTIEEGIHTTDIFKEGTSRQKVGTRAFGEAVVERLGEVPQELAAVHYAENPPRMALNLMTHRRPAAKDLFGVDVFLDWTGPSPDHLAAKLQACLVEGLNLVLITNRGVKVWPNGWPETFTTDHWRCRFRSTTRENTINHRHIIDLLSNIERAGLDFIKTEHLYNFDGAPGYSLGLGE